MGQTLDIAKATIKGTGSDIAYGTKHWVDEADRATQPDPPAAQTPSVDYAQKTAASNNDMNTIKSTLGMHPVEAHFQSTGPRHQLGRGVPK